MGLPFWFRFRKNEGGELTPYLVEFLLNIHKIFGHIINYLLTSLLQSVLVKCRTFVFLHGPRLAALARSVLKTSVRYFTNTDLTLGEQVVKIYRPSLVFRY